MSTSCSGRRARRGDVDAIADERSALTFLSAITERSESSVVALLLDHRRRGISVLRVNNASDHGAILHVATEIIARAHQHPDFSAVILATTRPAGDNEIEHLADIDRWMELDRCFAANGIELIEWFVLSSTTATPRAALGTASRWWS